VAETLLDVKERLGASLILIGHDMGLQAQMVDRLGVMYRGKLVEVGPVREMFKVAVHPYTKLLIASIPSIGEKKLEARDHKALAKTVGTVEGCVLGSACPGPADDGEALASPMHELTPGHLVACEAGAKEAIA
jgi:oligopeptide/dipeptide ABC transporter ATP-binding protein